jgi:hypothetical protein
MLVLASAGATDAARPQNAPECRAVDTPKRLPTVAELVDSTALAIQIAGAPVTESPEIQLGVAFPQPSGPPQAWVIDSGVSPDAQARLAVLVQAALRANGAPPGTTLRIHLRVTTPIGVRVQRSILCAPVPLDSARSTQPAVQVIDGVSNGPRQSWKAVIRQRIGTDGFVLDARLQPGSGQPEMDRLALLPVFARRWQPATLDGRPVAVWFANGRVELAR